METPQMFHKCCVVCIRVDYLAFLRLVLVILGQNVRKTVIIANNDPILPGTDPRNGTRTLESPQILIISRLRGQLISQSRKNMKSTP